MLNNLIAFPVHVRNAFDVTAWESLTLQAAAPPARSSPRHTTVCRQRVEGETFEVLSETVMGLNFCSVIYQLCGRG